MFSPSRADVRGFFRAAHRKRVEGAVLTPLESIAAGWADEHPEYAALLDAPDAEADAPMSDAEGDSVRENPFLHLSMHLAISEQLQIDQPPGLRAASERLAARLGSAHAAQHAVMECLGEVLWRAQRDRTAPDAEAYLECVRRRAMA